MPEIKNIPVTDYTDYEGTDHVLVDVREVDEYEDGHLPGAVNIPLSSFAEGFREIPETETVVLVCKMGGRSMQAATFLGTQDEKPYEFIVNLDGGTQSWMEAGNPIEK